jgi:anti-sigma regulatory factor (Ser/Thr protein kinase)
MAAGGTAGTDDAQRVVLRLVRKKTSVRKGRLRAVELARKASDSDDVCYRVEQSAAELLANAVIHGAGKNMRITVTISATVYRLAVHDQGGTGLKPLPGQDDLSGRRGDYGRGLTIVDALADVWGASSARGTTVWFEIDLSGLRDSAAAPAPAGPRRWGSVMCPLPRVGGRPRSGEPRPGPCAPHVPMSAAAVARVPLWRLSRSRRARVAVVLLSCPLWQGRRNPR